MARIAKYLKAESKRTQHFETYKKSLDRFVAQKKLYDSTNKQIVEMFFDNRVEIESFFSGDDQKKFWENLRSKLLERKLPDGYRETLKKMLVHVAEVSETFFVEPNNFKIISTLAQLETDFVRPFEKWVPKSRNRFKQVYDLLRHLFAKYDVPEFLDKGFVNAEIESVTLFTHIGSGKSFKTFELAPDIVLNKKSYHYILSTPENFTYFEAFRRAQVLSLGGSDRLAYFVLGSKLRTLHNHKRTYNNRVETAEEFWATIISFFVQQPMFDYDHVSTIIDYIFEKKFQTHVENGRMIGPEIPDFSIKGRTIQALLRQTLEWHEQLARVSKKTRNAAKTWKGVEIEDFEVDLTNKNSYEIVQLKSAAELSSEGTAMRHCVGSYAHNCANGNTSIWSLRHTRIKDVKFVEPKRMLTIEVGNTTRSVVQIRGKNNARAEAYEMSIVNLWAGKANLSVSRYA